MTLKKIKFLTLLFIPIIISCKNTIVTASEKSSVPSVPNCGDGRWDIKTGLDSGARKIVLDVPEKSTVAKLLSYTSISIPTDNIRIEPLETKVYTIETTIIKFKVDYDKGYHLILKDKTGNLMSANIPEPSCVNKLSPFLTGILDSKKEFDLKFRATKKYQNTNTPVKITGIGFLNMQGIESPVQLFPVIGLNFSR